MLGAALARSARLSPAQLATHLASPNPAPLIIPHIADDWPARSTWALSDGLQKLRHHIGEERAVEVELGPRGRGYLDQRYKRISVGFGLFLDAFVLGRIPSSTPRSQRPIGYLAQYDIPLAPPPLTPSTAKSAADRTTVSGGLSEDLPYTAYLTSGPRQEPWRRTLWIGPAGTFTPFHKDPYIGIYTQLIGRKRFHLVPPSAAHHLAISTRAPYTNTSTIPISVSTIAAHTSSVPRNNPAAADVDQDLTDLPDGNIAQYADMLRAAFAADSACSAELGPGESVLIPEGWYHSAEGLDVGVGVNAWFR